MWKKIIKAGLLGLGICCLGITAGPDVQAAGLSDASSRAAAAQKQYARMMDNQPTGLEQTDPELDSMMKKYIYGDIASQAKISRRDQHLVTLAVLTTYQSEDLLAQNVQGALHDGVTPLEIRETEYHLAPYIGFAKVSEAMKTVNQVFRKNGIRLPLPDQGTTTDANRFDKGLAFQVGTYGDRINKMRAATPKNQKHLQDDLSAFCFGDIYTRGTLDLKTREMITIAAIGALGTGDPQFKSHVRGTLAAGASQDEVIGVLTTMNPYIGFPRTLNLLRLTNEVFQGK
jgi:4-carboxymuconolactone decarboxylase